MAMAIAPAAASAMPRAPLTATSRLASRPTRTSRLAAVRGHTGPQSTVEYTRPDLAILDLGLAEAVKAHSSRAAQDPQLYAHKLAAQQQQAQQQAQQAQGEQRINWCTDIL